MTRALILGVDGQDGSYLAEFLLDLGYQVVGWIPQNIPVSLENISYFQDRIVLVKGDLGDQDSLAACLEEHTPDEIYNLAAPSSPSASWDAGVSVGDLAGLGVARLLEGMRRICPRARFYQASSSEMFGEPSETPQNEKTPFRPRNPYGVAKLYAHWMTVRYRQHFGLFAISGILFNHESPRRGPHFVTRKIARGAARIKLGLEKELRLGNLDARRDWGYAPDYVRGMCLMLRQDQPEDYVLATGRTHSVQSFVELAFEAVGLDYREYVVQDPRFMRPADANLLVGDPSKAKERLGWEATTSFDELVRIMVEAELGANQE